MKNLAVTMFKTGIASLVGAAIMVPVTLIALSAIQPPPYFTAVFFAAFLLTGILLIIGSGIIHLVLKKTRTVRHSEELMKNGGR